MAENSLQVAQRPRPDDRRHHIIGRRTSGALVVVTGVIAALAAVLAVTTIQNTMGLATVVCLYFAVFAFQIARGGRARELLDFNEGAVAKLQAGRADEAAVELDALCKRARVVPRYHALFVLNRGVTAMQQGEFETASRLFGEVLRSDQLPGRNKAWQMYKGLALSGAGEAAIRLGRISEAEAALEAARSELSEERRVTLAPLEAMINLRSDRPEHAERALSEHWDSLQGMVSGATMREVCLLRAFALSKLDSSGDRRSLRKQLEEAARPFEPGRYDNLARHWPEFGEYLRGAGFID